MQGINGLKRITSSSNEGYGSINIEVENGYDIDEVKDEVKSQVDAITSFPDDAEKPTIRSFDGQPEVITIAVHGHVDEASLLNIAEKVRDEVSELPNITKHGWAKSPEKFQLRYLKILCKNMVSLSIM